ncbi:hypothetical protein [Actinomadura sp. 9N407]|uniref:hypothetical protein n=1 Tax=Actinomadura sp. 9N407 TaxID=3375154 RepID=UPI00378870B8
MLIVALGAVTVLSLVGFVLLELQSPSLSGPLKAEQCVGARFEVGAKSNTIPASLRVACEDPKAKAKVVKITREGKRSSFQVNATSSPDCPDGADGVTHVSLKTGDAEYWEACVRNLKGPHPGDPGAGGAMISTGDCVGGATVGFGREEPCSGSDWYGKVISRADSPEECPAPQTLETMTLKSFSGGAPERPVLCLGRGGGVIGAGDCIQDPSFAFGGLKKANCGTDDAIAKVEARVKTKQECPSTATHFLESEEALLKVMCLKKLRDTPLERLESLVGS